MQYDQVFKLNSSLPGPIQEKNEIPHPKTATVDDLGKTCSS